MSLLGFISVEFAKCVGLLETAFDSVESAGFALESALLDSADSAFDSVEFVESLESAWLDSIIPPPRYISGGCSLG